jgi:capsid protein
VRADIRVLRRRARELVRDNAYARRFTRILTKNIIGPHGIRPVPTNVGANGSRRRSEPRDHQRVEGLVAFPETASTDTLHSWTELEGLIIRTIACTDGECFIRLWPGFDNAYGFAVELLDPDLLDEQFNREASSGMNEIRMGIERDRFVARSSTTSGSAIRTRRAGS